MEKGGSCCWVPAENHVNPRWNLRCLRAAPLSAPPYGLPCRMGRSESVTYGVLEQHSVSFSLGSLSTAQGVTLVEKCCAGRKRHLGSSRETWHVWVVCGGTKRCISIREYEGRGGVCIRERIWERVQLSPQFNRPKTKPLWYSWSPWEAAVKRKCLLELVWVGSPAPFPSAHPLFSDFNIQFLAVIPRSHLAKFNSCCVNHTWEVVGKENQSY